MPSTRDPMIDALKGFTTCDISQALCHLGHLNGGSISGLTLWSPERQAGTTKVVGPAYTVKYASNDDPAPKIASHYIDSVPKGAVVFVSGPRDNPNGLWSSLVTARGQAQGAAGVVVDGRVRDLGEHREHFPEFPVFARDTGTAPPSGSVKVVGVDVPVKLAAAAGQDVVVVRPGDYLVGDLNGVVVVPRETAGEVVALAEKQETADALMMVEILKGMSLGEASKKFRG